MPMGLADPKIQEKTFYRAADICMALNFVMDPFIYVLFRGRCHRCCCCSWQTLFMCFASFFRRSKEERKPVFYQESSSRIRPPTTANEFILPSGACRFQPAIADDVERICISRAPLSASVSIRQRVVFTFLFSLSFNWMQMAELILYVFFFTFP